MMNYMIKIFERIKNIIIRMFGVFVNNKLTVDN